MNNSLQPYGLQTTRLLCPWDFPGKNTGVGCHFPLQANLPNTGIKPVSLASPALAGGFFATSATREFLVKLYLRFQFDHFLSSITGIKQNNYLQKLFGWLSTFNLNVYPGLISQEKNIISSLDNV